MRYYINTETKDQWRGGQHGVEFYSDSQGWIESVFVSTTELIACHDVIEVDECGHVLRDVQP